MITAEDNQHYDRFHHDQVAGGNGLEDQAPQTGQIEHLLDDDRVPAIRKENCMPMMVSTGIMRVAQGHGATMAWRCSARPLARAVRMKSSPSTSISAERMTRVRMAAWGKRQRDGRQGQRECNPGPEARPPSPQIRPPRNQREANGEDQHQKHGEPEVRAPRLPSWVAPMTAVSPASAAARWRHTHRRERRSAVTGTKRI